MEKNEGQFVRGTIACALGILLSIACTKAPTVVGGAGGAVIGGAGGPSSGAGGSDPGAGSSGSNSSDAAVPQIKLDVQPAWWGTADGPQPPDVLTTPTADANCGAITSRTTRQPADVLLVLDRSASMDYSITEDCYCTNTGGGFGNLCTDTSNCTTRWEAIEPAVTTTVTNSMYVNWALKFFPSSGTGGGNCRVNNTIEVQFGDGSATDVASQVNSATFDLSTPTAAGLVAATNYLKTLDAGSDKFILLATDGEPNCGGSPANINTVDVTGASAAAAAAYAAGFKVFVVGIGPNLGNLTELAKAGGTTDYYSVSSPEDLSKALSSISKLVGSCSFKSADAPPDPTNVAVYVNGHKVESDASNGWTYGSTPQEVVLTGDYCAEMSTGNQVDVQILFGCPGQPDFPPDIY
jgi:hypothetical protein